MAKSLPYIKAGDGFLKKGWCEVRRIKMELLGYPRCI
jgi:hypothetical protein